MIESFRKFYKQHEMLIGFVEGFGGAIALLGSIALVPYSACLSGTVLIGGFAAGFHGLYTVTGNVNVGSTFDEHKRKS